MNQKKDSDRIEEKWYIFDMYAEHVDPRFLYWLYQHGIIAQVHAGGARGLIANTIQELPPETCVLYRGLTKEEKAQFEPMFTIVEPTQSLSGAIKLLDKHDALHGKLERPTRNTLNENFGRPPKREIVLEYFQETLATIFELIGRLEECDRLGLNSEFLAEIKEASDAVEFLRECIDNNLR